MEYENRISDKVQIEASIEKLCYLMECQLVCARAGNLSEVEALGDRTNEIVAEIARVVQDVPSVIEPQRRRLEKLYHELGLVLESGRDDIRDRLEQLRQVKRAVGTYRQTNAL